MIRKRHLPLLKPCPFCGGNRVGVCTAATRAQVDDANKKGIINLNYVVCCGQCGAEGPLALTNGDGTSELRAIKLWNKGNP
jgi:Lar family restriction alleviation protein